MSPSQPSSSRTSIPSTESAFSFETADLIEILEDLSTRFILNLPESESESIPRLCFQVEQAYWFYEDWVRDSQPNLPSYTLKRFSEIFFKVCPMLSKWSDKHERLFLEFMRYKTRVPVCGAVMINETWDKCVLVKGWKGNSWSFPKGKINQEEEKHICAIREVLEETGCDLINLLKTDEPYFHETTISDQRITLYFVPGVPEDFPFETQTRKEIGAIEWFKLSDLPTWKKAKTTSTPKLAGKGKFYMILPFVLELKKFVKSHRPLKHSSSPLPTPSSESTLPTPLEEDPPSETEVSSTPVLPESPAQLREAPVPLSELDELFARFLSSERGDDHSRSASAGPRVDQDVEEEDENEGTVMGASEEVEEDKPPTTSILDEMFGALTMPTAPPPPPPSNLFSPPPQPNYPHAPNNLSQPQPQHTSSLLSLFSNLPPPPLQQHGFQQSNQSRPPPNASLLALLNPSIPSPALNHSSPMYHYSRPTVPPSSLTSSIPQSHSPTLTNDKQSLLAMFSPPPTRSVPGAPSSSNAQDQSEEARKTKKQMALLAMMDASLGGGGSGFAGGAPPPPPQGTFNGQSPMNYQQQPIYNQPSPYVAQQFPVMPPNPHQSPYATHFPPRPPPPNLNGDPLFPPNLNGPPPPLFPHQQQQQLNGNSPFAPHPQPSFEGFPVVQSPRMTNFNNGGRPPPPLPLGPGAPGGPGAFHNGVPSYPGQMPNGFRGQPGGPMRAPLIPPTNFPPPGSNSNSNGPPPPFLSNPNSNNNPNLFQSPQRQQPQPFRGQPSLPPPSSSSSDFPPLPSSNGTNNGQQQQQRRDPFTVNPMLQQQMILTSPSSGSRPNTTIPPNGTPPQQQQQQVPIHHPKPQGMTNHAESLLGMLKGGGGGAGGRVANVNQPGYPSGSPAVGR